MRCILRRDPREARCFHDSECRAGSNRPISLLDLNQTRTVNAANEITAITESTGPAWIDPAYDAAGNMTTIPQPADLTAGYTGTYDAWNRLVKLADGMTTVAEYEYDGENRRIVKVDKTGMADVTYDYFHNEEWQTLEVRKDADADPYEQYVWHPHYIDAIVLRDYDPDTDGSAARYYSAQDANFNVTAATNSSGTVVERYAYTPYGELQVLDANFATDADGLSDIGNSVTYTGREFDAESGLYHYRNRYYHGQVGLFVSRDPVGYIGSPLNLYEYVSSAPITSLDPTGTIIELDVLDNNVCAWRCTVRGRTHRVMFRCTSDRSRERAYDEIRPICEGWRPPPPPPPPDPPSCADIAFGRYTECQITATFTRVTCVGFCVAVARRTGNILLYATCMNRCFQTFHRDMDLCKRTYRDNLRKCACDGIQN